MPLSVIGAGYPRTGTLSLKLALEHLGFGPCHHMIEVIHHPEQASLWARAFDEDGIDWDVVLAGYNSSCDAPSCFVYDKLAARYPDAKVILGVRSAESWWKSASSTVMAARPAGGGPPAAIAPMVEKMRNYAERHNRPMPNPMAPDPEASMDAFNRHNEEVKRTISAERLLVFEAKQGWGPLCKFLGVPVPSIPYPRVNTTEDFQAMTASAAAQGGPPPIPRIQ
jgi:hypothetical protein